MAQETPTTAADRRGPPPPNAAVLLIALGRHARERVDARLAEHDLTYRHLSALGHLARHPDLSYSELGRRVGVTAQSMQATLTQLENRGAVERTTTIGRGRTARLRVTGQGHTLLGAGLTAVTRVEQELLAALGPADRDQLTTSLLTTFLHTTGSDRAPERE